MIGTIINVAGILVGTFFGLFFGKRINEQIRNTIISGIGIFTLFLGLSMFLKSEDSVVCLIGLVIGTIIGELTNIERGLENLGGWFQSFVDKNTRSDYGKDRQKFIQAFLTGTMLFAIGPVSILGSIQDGLTGDYQLLLIKSILDGVTSIVFATTMGIGVAFSVIPIFIYQGTITLLAEQAQSIMNDSMIAGMTAVGGVMLGAIAISSLLNIKKIRVSSMIPALFITPFLFWITTHFNF